MGNKQLSLAVVIPMLNEAENAPSLIAEIQAASQHAPITEIVIVDDGSTDDTAQVILSLRKSDPRIRLIKHTHRSGQSAGIRTGVTATTAELVVTMDGDGQNNPADIPSLYNKFIITPDVSMLMVAGQRAKRQDSLLKKFTSRTGNFIRRTLLRDGVRDTGCSLKMFRRNDYLRLPYFNHMHRFLPALFIREHGKIELVDVGHRHRERGISKYGFWDRLWAGMSDIFGVMWLMSRAPNKTDIIEVKE
ncbi:MAG: glycosyltransferase family 2 protein [Alphaproteobacteria bacterium]|nr:glycosyltransferase family 2 protein [Alphaproteobacteria bacterium]MCB9985406.1 glycosyltransferase family 2 protein [Micavibrio sp.]HPQ51081.1 glycosyltransferase family 2 protein [Alphaproteobacteria bacterium]HRK98183.1 glycosyltransferase family 2 protein [Alphaproteobacteria bacterium]